MGLDLAGGALAGVTGGASLLPWEDWMGGGGGGSTSQVALRSPEQKAAQQALLRFSQTGQFGDFQAGAQVPLGYGDFNATGLENQGQSQLQSLLNGGIPSQYAMGDQALQDILGQGQGGIQAQFAPFQDQVARQTSEANRALMRGAGFAGNLYSTDTIRQLGDVQARGNETLSSHLAGLTNDALNRKLQAVPLAYQSAQAQQGARLQQIDAASTYGALTRQLNDQSIKARDAELLRRRQELQLPIQAATNLAGMSSQFGVPEVKNPSPYAQLLGLAGQVGGTALGTYFGGPMGGAVGGKVGGQLGSTAGGWSSNGSQYGAIA